MQSKVAGPDSAGARSPIQRGQHTQQQGEGPSGIATHASEPSDVQQSQYGSSSQVLSAPAPARVHPIMDGTFQTSQALPAAQLHTGPGGTLQPNSETGHSSEALRGFIAAGCLGLGDIMSFSFSSSAAEVRLTTKSSSGAGAGSSPVHQTKQHLQRQAGLSSHKHIYVEHWSGGSAEQSRGQHAHGSSCQESGAAHGREQEGFSWVPRGLGAVHSLGLPRRVCWPLQQTSGCAPRYYCTLCLQIENTCMQCARHLH